MTPRAAKWLLAWLIVACSFLAQFTVGSDSDVCGDCDETSLCLAASVLLSCYTNRTRCSTTPEVNTCQFNVWKWWCSTCDDSCFFAIPCLNSLPSEIKWSASATDYWPKRSCTEPDPDSCPLVLRAKSPSELSELSSSDNVSQIQNRTTTEDQSPGDSNTSEKSKKKKPILTTAVIGIISGCGLAAIAIVFRFANCWRRRKVIKVSSRKDMELRQRNLELKSAQHHAGGMLPPKRPAITYDLDSHAERVSSQFPSARGPPSTIASLPPTHMLSHHGPYHHPPSVSSMYSSRSSVSSYPGSTSFGPSGFAQPPQSSMYRSAPHHPLYSHTPPPHVHAQMVAQPTPPVMFSQVYHQNGFNGPPTLASQYASNRSGGSAPYQPYHYY